MRLSEIQKNAMVIMERSYYDDKQLIGCVGRVEIIGCFNINVYFRGYKGIHWVAYSDLEPLVSVEEWTRMSTEEQKQYVVKHGIKMENNGVDYRNGFGDCKWNKEESAYCWEYPCNFN